ncbi:hypothetical protein HNQ07_003784 [Deinococcus metalli]|uniref:Uncharacterized protein n=1 Tax=Deinococcus metalli TaxID=1141878 RepID=A0A7W8KIC5_9DEIO|nr:hypothetical protein [Deinococcus metalli]MBB5378283.1 hypothetical protein [Deinococcus metalli]GHF57408.1 hypothetical protein GCM10017781_37220 [Deinococcus metalli]
MHVPAIPHGSHPIGNYRLEVDPHGGSLIRVQVAGAWHTVTPATAEEGRTLISVLHSPFACVEEGWIVGRRSP